MAYLSQTKSKIFLYILIAFIVGIGIASWLPREILYQRFWFFAGAAACLYTAVVFKRTGWASPAGWALAAFLLGIWRYGLALPADTPDRIWHYRGQEIGIAGAVSQEPEEREKGQRLVVEAGELEFENNERRAVGGSVLVYAPMYPKIKYGDKLEIAGRLEAIQPFDDFAYDRYLARYDIYAAMYYPKIKFAGQEANWFYRRLYAFKDRIRDHIRQGLDEPAAGLALAFFLGDRGTLDRDLQAAFSRSGLSHIVAISGAHIAIAAALIAGALYYAGLSRQGTFYILSAFLAFYTVLVGAPASAVRSAIMAWLVLFAFHIGRLHQGGRILALAAAVMLAFNPRLLSDDAGFQLSFLAILGMLVFYPKFNRLLEKYHPRLDRLSAIRWLWSAVALTLAAQILTWPVIAHGFSIVSLVAPFSNLAVVWVSAPLLVSLFIGTAISAPLPSLAVFAFAPARFILWFLIKAGEISAGLPGAYVDVELSFIWLATYYLSIALVLFGRQKLRN